MNRLTRIFAAALLTAAMLVVLTPAAQARPLGKPQPVLGVDGGWIDAALSWLTQLLGAPQAPAARNAREKASSAPTNSTTTGSGGGGGFTGSCIDPNGCIIVDRGSGK
jgi:hypothetical protein